MKKTTWYLIPEINKDLELCNGFTDSESDAKIAIEAVKETVAYMKQITFNPILKIKYIDMMLQLSNWKIERVLV